jgi:hypothetical protein
MHDGVDPIATHGAPCDRQFPMRKKRLRVAPRSWIARPTAAAARLDAGRAPETARIVTLFLLRLAMESPPCWPSWLPSSARGRTNPKRVASLYRRCLRPWTDIQGV